MIEFFKLYFTDAWFFSFTTLVMIALGAIGYGIYKQHKRLF